MKKQQLLVINYLLRLKAIILRHPPKGGRKLNNTTDDNFTFVQAEENMHLHGK
jgi:hypothetical protein